MSADNGIYIAIFGDGEYRVAYTQAIDNCWDEEGREIIPFIVYLFADTPAFSTFDEAWAEAKEIEEDCEYTEYGINTIHFQNKFEFYQAEVVASPELYDPPQVETYDEDYLMDEPGPDDGSGFVYDPEEEEEN